MPIYENQQAQWRARIREATQDLPLYQGGPGVDYTAAPEAFALNITLLHGARRLPASKGYVVRPDTEILLGRRRGGHGLFSGISGYIDEPQQEEPLAYTAFNELREEAQLSEGDCEQIDLFLGDPFVLPHQYEGGVDSSSVRPRPILHLLPMVGICTGPDKPSVRPNLTEVTEYRWISLNRILHQRDVSEGYATQTLPHALRALSN